MSPGRPVRLLAFALALGAPYWLAARAAEDLTAPLAARVATTLSRLVAPLAGSDRALAEPACSSLAESLQLSPPTVVAALKAVAPRAGKSAARAAVQALVVSQATVLRLAQSAARPSGRFVASTAEHPAGIALSGVQGLGIGVQEGDILIEALGTTPTSPGQLIGAIIEARAHNARWLSGTLWRRGQRIPISVEQPYLRGAEPG